MNHSEKFFRTRLDNLSQQFAWHKVITVGHKLREVDHFIFINGQRVAMPIGYFQLFGDSWRQTQTNSDIASNQVTTNWQDGCLPDSTIGEDGDIRSAAANI